MKIGIVGLPNVGKSTLFNALTKSSGAQVANYPFCTIDPNVGIVEVPDSRIEALAEIVKPARKIPAIVEFVDIAGLVKGASLGEGLGNQFLANIRECDAIGQVVRLFHDDNVAHVHGGVDASRDLDIIETELILADLQTLEKRLYKAQNDAKSGEKEKIAYFELLKKVKSGLESGIKFIDMDLSNEEKKLLSDLRFLSAKPFLYILNVSDHELAAFSCEKIKKELGLETNQRIIPISAKVEEELVNFEDDEAIEYLNELGIKERGLIKLIQEAYDTLGLQTFFTAGPKEVRAWTIKKGATAPEAAGVIHSDFEKNFIRAEVINWKDFVEAGGENAAREKGLLRIEGKDYRVQGGDVIHFRHS